MILGQKLGIYTTQKFVWTFIFVCLIYSMRMLKSLYIKEFQIVDALIIFCTLKIYDLKIEKEFIPQFISAEPII